MVTTVSRGRSSVARRAGIALLLTAAIPLSAAATTAIEPEITLGATWTDNVFLDAVGGEEEYVYNVTPSIRIIQESQRFEGEIEYQFEGYRYQELQETESYHRFDGDLTTTLVRDALFVELGGSRTQSLRDPEGTVPIGNLPFSGNRVDRDEGYVEPYVDLDIGSNATLKAAARNTWVRYREGDFAENESRYGNFSLDNYRVGHGLTWAAKYEWQRALYEDASPWEYQRATGELGAWVGESLRVFGAGGRESAWDMPLDPSLEDTFWEVGFVRDIGERMRLEMALGERSFGTSYRASMQLEFRRGTSQLSYDEVPSTEGIYRFQRGGLRFLNEPDDFQARVDGSSRFIMKRFQWNLNLDYNRSMLNFVAFNRRRTDRTEADGTPLGDEDQYGATLAGRWDAGARTQFVLRANYVDRNFESGADDSILRAELSANYRLGTRTALSLGYRYVEQDRGVLVDPDAPRGYEANSVNLTITREFYRSE